MTIGRKIAAGYGLVLALTVSLGVFCLYEFREVFTITERLTDRDFAALTMLRHIQEKQVEKRTMRERVLAVYQLQKSGIAVHESYPLLMDRWKQTSEEIKQLITGFQTKVGTYTQGQIHPGRKAKWEALAEETSGLLKAVNTVNTLVLQDFELIEQGKLDRVAERVEVLDRLRDEFNVTMDNMERIIREATELSELRTQESYQQASRAVIAVLVAVILIGILSGVAIHRSITRPLNSFMQVMERVGSGDLTQSARESSDNDEISRLGQSLNRMVANLRELTVQSRAAIENLTTAAAEILAATQQQAAGTAEQAAAVQETTSTMEEINQSGNQVSSKAREVSSAAESSSSASSAGLQAVQEMAGAMDLIREQAESVAATIVALSEKTQAVGEIVAGVNDIAEQSNLLALNAAIEAAAAGEHGRSFSVVAGEIKALADQARAATVQVRSILGDIQKGINTAVMLTEEAVKRADGGRQKSSTATETIRQMNDSTVESIQTFQQITAAAGQQAMGFEQVVQALKNIRLSSEQTAAGTRQLEQAAANLSALASQLRAQSERYRL